MAISDFLTDRSAVQFGRSNGPMSGVAQTVSNGIVEGVRNGISEFLNNPGGPADQPGTGYGQPADWGPFGGLFGNPQEAFASPFSTTDYGQFGSAIGNVVAGPFGGLIGAGFGGYQDIDNLDTQQASLGFGDPLGARQVLSGFLNQGTFGLLGTSWEDGAIANLQDGVAAYEQANPELMNRLNQDSWADDRISGWDGGYGGWAGREFARDDDDRGGPGASGDDDSPSNDRDDDNETGGGD